MTPFHVCPRSVLLCIEAVHSHRHTEKFLHFSGLGFVRVGPFHCAYRFICVYLCVFCVFLFHTALLYYCEHGGMDLMGLKPP